MTRLVHRILLVSLLGAALTACAPEVGSERWCKKMRDTPKADWTASNAADYAKSCVLKPQD